MGGIEDMGEEGFWRAEGGAGGRNGNGGDCGDGVTDGDGNHEINKNKLRERCTRVGILMEITISIVGCDGQTGEDYLNFPHLPATLLTLSGSEVFKVPSSNTMVVNNSHG